MKKNIMSHMAKYMKVGILLVCAIIIVFTKTVFAEKNEAVSNADFVLVIDCSGSMIDNDQLNLTKDAAKYFVSMLPLHKTRLAVIVFGNDYGDSHYRDHNNIWEADLDSGTSVKVAYELTEIKSEEERRKAREAIENEVNRDGDWSPVGYAFEAAVRKLNEGGAEKGKAAIVLITDGQVDGEQDIKPNNIDFYSIDSAVNRAVEQKWPVYCMELNYAGENRQGSGLPGIAYHLMREYIPDKTGTSPIELKSADQAKMEMLNIFKKFFDPNSIVKSIYGEKEETINITDMVAEENINLVGDISRVTSIELTSPKGEKYEYENISGERQTDEGVVYFDESAAFVKLIIPDEGMWKITVHTNGDTNLAFRLVPIAIREMDLHLSASVESGEITRGTEMEFSASFSYDGKDYGYEQFYSKTDARLVIEGTNPDEIKMTAEGALYKASYVFDKAGSYYVHVSVGFPHGLNKEKRSIEEYSYLIEIKETLAKGSVPDQTLKVGGDATSIDMSDYYESPDGHALVYSVEMDKDVSEGDLEYSIDEKGKLSIVSGQRSGLYILKVGACDGKGEKEVWQSVNVTVGNSSIQLLGDGKPINVSLLSDGSDEYVLRYDDYFYDADGAAPIIHIRPVHLQDDEVSSKNQESCYVYEQDGEKLVIRGTGVGKAEINIQAIDGNDLQNYELLLLRVNVISSLTAAWERFKLPLIVIGAILALTIIVMMYSFIGRKIYGSWRITFLDGSQLDYPSSSSNLNGNYSDHDLRLDSDDDETFEIWRLRHCKGASVPLDRVLSDIGRIGGFGPEVKLVAGSKGSNDVFLKGIGKLDSCELNDDQCDKKASKVRIMPYNDVVLKCDRAELYIKLGRTR